jgi:GNAT superfamily N-acetyltransferase
VNVRIRGLEPADIPALLGLIDGLADYEKLARPDAQARERLARDAFADPFRTLLAVLDGTPIGYAMYFFTYSSFLARPSLYLEDIFVLPEHRGHGAGLGLFRACAQAALDNDCGRMEWQVLSWNEPSIRFYERLGARQLDTWLPFRMDRDVLVKVATPD